MGACWEGPELGSLTGGGGAAVPYGEQRYNECLHLLAWTPKDSRTKLYDGKSLMNFYRFWNVSEMAAALGVNRFFTAVWPGHQLPSITSLSWEKTTASSLKTSQCHSQVEICHRASVPNTRSAEARAVCLMLYPPIRLADPSVELYIDSCRPELCCHCVFENRCCWRQCPSVNNVMPRLEYWAGRAYVARWPTMEKGRWKAIISTWSPVEPNGRSGRS